MGDSCDLRAANGEEGATCEGVPCPFWRVVEHVGDAPGVGCAIKHYQLRGDDGVASWLLSVRERLQTVEQRDDRDGAS